MCCDQFSCPECKIVDGHQLLTLYSTSKSPFCSCRSSSFDTSASMNSSARALYSSILISVFWLGGSSCASGFGASPSRGSLIDAHFADEERRRGDAPASDVYSEGALGRRWLRAMLGCSLLYALACSWVLDRLRHVRSACLDIDCVAMISNGRIKVAARRVLCNRVGVGVANRSDVTCRRGSYGRIPAHLSPRQASFAAHESQRIDLVANHLAA